METLSALFLALSLQMAPVPEPIITLTKANTVVLDQEVTEQSVGITIQALHEKVFAGVKEVYLVLNTPGGSVIDGMRLIDTITSLPIKVHAVVIFAASMGYQITQNTHTRFILPSGTLMSHRASGGMRGEFNGNFESRVNYIKQLVEILDQIAANRIGITLKQYQELIRDELWISGHFAVDGKQADKVAKVMCGKDMMGTDTKIVPTPFGTFKVTLSNCPLITAPISVEMSNNSKELANYINLLFFNKPEFVSQFITKTGVK